MHSKSLFSLLAATFLTAASLTACTFDAGQNLSSNNGEFSPPLMYPDWDTQQMTSASGKRACAITSGTKGLQVLVESPESGGGLQVSHQRRYSTGMLTTLSVNGHVYRTSTARFHDKDAGRIVHDLTVADKAYLEWNEIYLSVGSKRLRTSTIIPLDDFKAHLAACERSLSR